jgi:hypothetical protein
VIPPDRASSADELVAAFLDLLDRDLKMHPDRESGFSKHSLARAIRLTKDVKVTDDDFLPETVTI